MTQQTRRGDRTPTGAVPSTVLIVAGLLIALLASIFLFFQLRDDSPSTAAPPTTSPRATEDAAPATSDAPQATTSAPGSDDHSDDDSDEPTTDDPEPYAAPTSDPAWIRISTGGVDGEIIPQGLAADGTINPGRNEIIWFTGYDRVSPGQIGTSVIAAHVTWEGAPDAFVDLPEVGLGDTVEIGYADGETLTFTVNEAYPIDKDDLSRSVSVWGDHPDHPRLAIITCDETQGYEADGHTSANYVLIAEA